MQPSFIPKSDLPKSRIGRPGTKWADFFKRMKETGEALCLYPKDAHQAHTMRSTARTMALKQSLYISTALRTEDDTLKLYIWII